jgi:hypothetical protein
MHLEPPGPLTDFAAAGKYHSRNELPTHHLDQY